MEKTARKKRERGRRKEIIVVSRHRMGGRGENGKEKKKKTNVLIAMTVTLVGNIHQEGMITQTVDSN